MKKLNRILFLLTILFSFIQAQDVDGDRIKESIRELGRKIEQIHSLAERYKNDAALRVIILADEDLKQAISLLKEWEDDHRKAGRLLLAKAKYQSAEKRADYASRLVLYKPMLNLKNDLESLLQQAETVSHNNKNNDIIYYLSKAREFHRKALLAFEKNRYLQGYEFVRIATYFANKTISFTKSDNDGINDNNSFNEQRNNIQNLLNQAGVLSENDAVLTDLYANADQYFEQSQEAYNLGNVRRAFNLLQLSERLLYRLIDLAESGSEGTKQNQVETNYLSLGRYLDAVRNEYNQSGQQSRLLEKAETLHKTAGIQLQNNELEKASSSINLSQSMAMRAFKKLSAPVDEKANIGLRFNEVERLLSMQKNKLENNPDPQLESLHLHAQQLFNASKQAQNQKQNVRAAYLLNMTLRLLNRVENASSKSTIIKNNPQQIQGDINRLMQIFSRLQNNSNLSTKDSDRINILFEMLQQANEEFEKNNLLSSSEIISLIQKQLGTIVTN
ncbi:MAG: hypothetical protein H6627_06645 [Calditrichae bacterium]|nr:hypothetical protein [Calditrichia bacterium]